MIPDLKNNFYSTPAYCLFEYLYSSKELFSSHFPKQKIRGTPTTITKVRGKIEKISYNQKLHNYNLERADLLQAPIVKENTSSMLHLNR